MALVQSANIIAFLTWQVLKAAKLFSDEYKAIHRVTVQNMPVKVSINFI